MSLAWRAAILVVGLLAVGGALAVRYHDDNDDASAPTIEASDDPDPEWDYVIPEGTADRLATGEEVEIMPGEITARVGESIRIDNQDREPHSLGPWYIGPGEVVTQRFASEGSLEGECNVHPSGQLRVVVAS